MKYVRMKSGEIDIMEDQDGIPPGSETIFSTEPAVYQGTWETEKLSKRADVHMTEKGKPEGGEPGTYGIEVIEGGTIKPEEQKRLEGHMRGGKESDRPFWTEPHKAHPKDKVCLNCGKPMPGVRPNRKFCSEKCRNTYGKRIRRKEARDIKDFKPHMGKEGQIYYMYNGVVGFIPALWCENIKKVERYIKANYPEEAQEVILEQVKEAMKNE
jgi:predicted nucleic acid-binding Zn ribbon protein